MESVDKLKQKPAVPRADKPEALVEENEELKEVVRRVTTIQSADQVSQLELEVTIPNTRYEDLLQAMNKSENLIHLVFGKNGTFMRAIPDVSRRQEIEYLQLISSNHTKRERLANDNSATTSDNDIHHHHHQYEMR
jgi:hypothetical protein